MNILDFLVYYTKLWYDDRKENLKWSSPIEKAIYFISLSTVFFLIAILEVIEYFVYHNDNIHLPLLPGVIFTFFISYIYKHVYIKKGRLNMILTTSKKSNFSDSTGKLLSLIILFIAFMLPFFILFIIPA